MRGAIDYAGQRICYRARHTSRTTLAISVLPNGEVEVVAPVGTHQAVIDERLRRRANWVLQQRRYFDQFQPKTPERLYVGGETHLYLGRQYRLKISLGAEDSVRLKDGYFWVSVIDRPSPDFVAALLSRWYRERAHMKLSERFAIAITRFPHVARKPPTLSVRPMRRRWGSFSAGGRITLNADLVRASLPCIDYVIIHELVHCRHPNHGRAFFNLLEQIMPDWERRKKNLERMLA